MMKLEGVGVKFKGDQWWLYNVFVQETPQGKIYPEEIYIKS